MMLSSFQNLALGLGGLGIACGLFARRHSETAQRLMRALPRNQAIGGALMLVNVIWSIILLCGLELHGKIYVRGMDLGEWNFIKSYLLYGSPALYLFILFFVNDYIGARAIAWFMILVAKPILSICFVSDHPLKLVIVTIAYLWIILGIGIFSVPHWMRDLVLISQRNPKRWVLQYRIGLALSCLLVGIGLISH